MKTMLVSSERQYEVAIVESWLADLQPLISQRTALAIVPNSIRAQLESQKLPIEVLEVPNGEEQKSLSNYGIVLEELARRRLDRSALLVGVGGGATTDLTGFLAATYLRGIDWIAVPTTVAAMVDAAIGGKTGLNLGAGKNLVGAFHSPNRVIVDLSWLKTLGERDRNAGLAEAVKCGFIADPRILELFESDPTSNLEEIVTRAIAVKARVVSADFKESFERESLNYGHTLGHAIERHSGYSLRHGEAVAIGMMFAAHLSARYSGLALGHVERHERILKKLNLPTTYLGDAWPELYKLMQNDKKRHGSQVRFVTLPEVGTTSRIDAPSEPELAKLYRETIAR